MHTGDASWAHQPSSQGHHCTTWRSSLFRAHLPRARLSGKRTFPLGYVPKLTPHTQVHTHPYRPAGTHPTGAHSFTLAHTHKCIHSPLHTCKHKLTGAHSQVHTHSCTLVHTHAHSPLQTCRHTPNRCTLTPAHLQAHTNRYTLLHTCTHTHTSVYTHHYTPASIN